ncbi:MAG: cytochrome C oxidase subunit IV family protein [Acidobacteria bacterium]|nr:cytochrome C oxidase subunit IV family protein [Acidobacteriota bacterium]
MHETTTRTTLSVWGWLLGLTALEVLLGYLHVPQTLLLLSVLGLSIVKAVLIMAYFMHLKFERLSLILTLVPVLVICLVLLAGFLPDGLRALNLRAFR